MRLAFRLKGRLYAAGWRNGAPWWGTLVYWPGKSLSRIVAATLRNNSGAIMRNVMANNALLNHLSKGQR